MKQIGLSIKRVDAYDKATGRAQYAADRCPENALIAKIVHSLCLDRTYSVCHHAQSIRNCKSCTHVTVVDR